MRRWLFFIQIFYMGVARLLAIPTMSIPSAERTGHDRLFPTTTISVDGQDVKDLNKEIRISAVAKIIAIQTGEFVWKMQDPQAARFRYMLDGVDNEWRQNSGDMGLAIFFYDKKYNVIKQQYFTVTNNSPRWNGTLDPKNLLHRTENLVVPPGAEKLSVIVTSAGAPDTFGVYVLQGLTLQRYGTGGSTTILQLGPSIQRTGNQLDSDPVQWMRDGNHPSMAHVVHLGDPYSGTDALCIMDDDPLAHAAWHLIDKYYPNVEPGELLTLDWNEMYSVGLCNIAQPVYSVPNPGTYYYRVQTVDVMGNPDKSAEFKIVVYTPYWMSVWFWLSCALAFSIPLFFTARHLIRIRFRQQLLKVEQEHMVERERLRIARDLHDDLGARLTHISLISSSWNKRASSEDIGETFNKISEMTRDLISSLYETVWTVDPSNDQLQPLVEHIIQMTDAMCGAASIRCRIQAPPMPSDYPVGGSVRHNLILAVKEALNNAIKHSGGSEITAEFDWKASELTVVISDNGKGFDVKSIPAQKFLNNIYRRVSAINGSSQITSEIERGTRVSITIPIPNRH
jgi:signal transduction histidine kinase